MALLKATQPVSVGGLQFDGCLTRTTTYKAEVPSYPIDDGYSVSDNCALDAMELSMTLYLTATPVTWSLGSGVSHMVSTVNQLVALYEAKDPIEVETQNQTYSDMVIKSITVKEDPGNGAAYEIPIELVQVTVTSSQTVEIPATLEHSGTTEEDSGTAATSTVTATASSTSSSSSSSSTTTTTTKISMLASVCDAAVSLVS